MQQFFFFFILKFDYSSTFFGIFPAHHQEHNVCSGSVWFYLRIVVTVANGCNVWWNDTDLHSFLLNLLALEFYI
jgi:hypothetical protein